MGHKRILLIGLPWSIAAASLFAAIWAETHSRFQLADITSVSNCGNGHLSVVILDRITGKVTITGFVDENSVSPLKPRP